MPELSKLWDAAKEVGQAIFALEKAVNDFGMGDPDKAKADIQDAVKDLKKAAADLGVPVGRE